MLKRLLYERMEPNKRAKPDKSDNHAAIDLHNSTTSSAQIQLMNMIKNNQCKSIELLRSIYVFFERFAPGNTIADELMLYCDDPVKLKAIFDLLHKYYKTIMILRPDLTMAQNLELLKQFFTTIQSINNLFYFDMISDVFKPFNFSQSQCITIFKHPECQHIISAVAVFNKMPPGKIVLHKFIKFSTLIQPGGYRSVDCLVQLYNFLHATLSLDDDSVFNLLKTCESNNNLIAMHQCIDNYFRTMMELNPDKTAAEKQGQIANFLKRFKTTKQLLFSTGICNILLASGFSFQQFMRLFQLDGHDAIFNQIKTINPYYLTLLKPEPFIGMLETHGCQTFLLLCKVEVFFNRISLPKEQAVMLLAEVEDYKTLLSVHEFSCHYFNQVNRQPELVRRFFNSLTTSAELISLSLTYSTSLPSLISDEVSLLEDNTVIAQQDDVVALDNAEGLAQDNDAVVDHHIDTPFMDDNTEPAQENEEQSIEKSVALLSKGNPLLLNKYRNIFRQLRALPSLELTTEQLVNLAESQGYETLSKIKKLHNQLKILNIASSKLVELAATGFFNIAILSDELLKALWNLGFRYDDYLKVMIHLEGEKIIEAIFHGYKLFDETGKLPLSASVLIDLSMRHGAIIIDRIKALEPTSSALKLTAADIVLIAHLECALELIDEMIKASRVLVRYNFTREQLLQLAANETGAEVIELLASMQHLFINHLVLEKDQIIQLMQHPYARFVLPIIKEYPNLNIPSGDYINRIFSQALRQDNDIPTALNHLKSINCILGLVEGEQTLSAIYRYYELFGRLNLNTEYVESAILAYSNADYHAMNEFCLWYETIKSKGVKINQIFDYANSKHSLGYLKNAYLLLKKLGFEANHFKQFADRPEVLVFLHQNADELIDLLKIKFNIEHLMHLLNQENAEELLLLLTNLVELFQNYTLETLFEIINLPNSMTILNALNTAQQTWVRLRCTDQELLSIVRHRDAEKILLGAYYIDASTSLKPQSIKKRFMEDQKFRLLITVYDSYNALQQLGLNEINHNISRMLPFLNHPKNIQFFLIIKRYYAVFLFLKFNDSELLHFLDLIETNHNSSSNREHPIMEALFAAEHALKKLNFKASDVIKLLETAEKKADILNAINDAYRELISLTFSVEQIIFLATNLEYLSFIKQSASTFKCLEISSSIIIEKLKETNGFQELKQLHLACIRINERNKKNLLGNKKDLALVTNFLNSTLRADAEDELINLSSIEEEIDDGTLDILVDAEFNAESTEEWHLSDAQKGSCNSFPSDIRELINVPQFNPAINSSVSTRYNIFYKPISPTATPWESQQENELAEDLDIDRIEAFCASTQIRS